MKTDADVVFRTGRSVQRADDCRPLTQAVHEGHVTLRALARGHYPGERLRPAEVPGLCSMGFWHAVGKQQYGLAPHRNEGIELTLALQGESPAMVDGKNVVLRSDSIMITRPWQLHSVGSPVFAKGKIGWLILDVGVRHPHQAWQWPEWVNLSASDLALLTQFLRQNEDAVRVATAALRTAFCNLVALADEEARPFRGSRMAVATSTVLLHLLELFHDHPVQLHPALTDSARTVRLYLQEIEHRPIPQSVEAMADACGLGVTRFSALFKESAGLLPGEYLVDRRLQVARDLLRTHAELSIEAIARQVGFSHGNYFARIFRQTFGVTPGQWRAEGKD